MLMVILGLVLIGLKWAGLGPTAAWPWWHVAVPFALAVLWWMWSDRTGRTARLAAERMRTKQENARQRRRDTLRSKL